MEKAKIWLDVQEKAAQIAFGPHAAGSREALACQVPHRTVDGGGAPAQGLVRLLHPKPSTLNPQALNIKPFPIKRPTGHRGSTGSGWS